MTITDIETKTRPPCVRSLAISTGVLLAAQIFHIFIAQVTETPQAHHSGPGKLAHIFGVTITIAALVAIWRRAPWSAVATTTLGIGAVSAMAVLHVLPIDSHFTSSFVGEATAIQWLGVVGVASTGVVAIVTGLRSMRTTY